MGLFSNLFGKSSAGETPASPEIDDEDNYIAWFVRYSDELAPVRKLYTKNLDTFVEVCVNGAKKELLEHRDGNALFARAGDLSVFFEKEVKPLVAKRGGLEFCPPQLQGSAVSIFVNILVLIEMLKKKYKHPEAVALFKAGRL